MSVTVFFIMRKNRTVKNSIMTQPHDYGGRLRDAYPRHNHVRFLDSTYIAAGYIWLLKIYQKWTLTFYCQWLT